MRRNPELISAIDPEKYANRFVKFMTDEVLISTNLIDLKEDEVCDMTLFNQNLNQSNDEF